VGARLTGTGTGTGTQTDKVAFLTSAAARILIRTNRVTFGKYGMYHT
jgi:hypothetical protein